MESAEICVISLELLFSDLMSMEVGQVRLLTLNKGENLQEKLFRLEKGMLYM